MFSAKKSSSERAAADDENYGFDGSSEITFLDQVPSHLKEVSAMRRMMFGLIAVCLLVTVVGCRSMNSQCGSGCQSGGAGCSGGACASKTGGAAGSGCAANCGGASDGCRDGFGLGSRSGRPHSAGICDCQGDDYCSSRAPWLRVAQQAPAPESIPAPLPPGKDQPDAKGKKL